MCTTLGSGSGLDQDKTLACTNPRNLATPRLEDGIPYNNDHAAR